MKKKTNFSRNETKEVKKFIIVLIIVTLVFSSIYLLTGFFVTKDLKKDTVKKTETTIDYSLILAGDIFNVNKEEYYIVAYDFNDDDADELKQLISTYSVGENHLSIYSINLSDALNKNHVSAESNLSTNNINELKFKNTTFLHIKNKNIIDYDENINNIKNKLNN